MVILDFLMAFPQISLVIFLLQLISGFKKATTFEEFVVTSLFIPFVLKKGNKEVHPTEV